MVTGPRKRAGSKSNSPAVGQSKGQKGSNKRKPSRASQQNPPEAECMIDYSQTKILILIESITGLDGSKTLSKQELKYPTDFSIKVSLGDEVLDLKGPYTVPDMEPFQIDYQFVYVLPKEAIDILASRPLKVTLLGAASKDKSGSRKRSGSAGRHSSKNAKSSSISKAENILVQGTIDLLPLLLGEIEIEEKVEDVMEVTVRLDGDKPPTPANLLYTTALYLYNPPPELLTSDVESCSIQINMAPQVQIDENAQVCIWNLIKFSDGHINSVSEELPPKKWFSIGNGPPSKTQYRNLPNEGNRIKDPEKLLTSNAKRSLVKITWNQMQRSFLNAQNQDQIIENLLKTGEWPMEIYVQRVVEEKKGKKKSPKISKKKEMKPTEDETPKPALPQFIGKLQLVDLLQPGVNSTRIVAQLETNPEIQLASVDEPPAAPVKISVDKPELQTEPEKEQLPEIKKVFDLDGRPSYLVVQVELYSSFTPRKTTEELLNSVKSYVAMKLAEISLGDEKESVCSDKEITNYAKSTLQAQAEFRKSIAENARFLQTKYQEFSEDREDDISLIENDEYIEELDKSGCLDLVRESVQTAVASYLRETSCGQQRGVNEIYCALVEETDSVLEELGETPNNGPEIRATSEELLDAAKFAVEEGNFAEADYFLYKRLHYYGEKDADYWTEIAVVSLRQNDKTRAIQCLLTALCLQPRHREALLMYAVVMAIEGDYDVAGLIFEALTTFHPRFYRGWFTYQCFFEMIENQQASDVCIALGGVCLKDKQRDDGIVKKSFWSSNVPPSYEDDVFIITAIYLLSLNLLQFAEMCLNHHRLETGYDTQPYLYYLGIAHHLQGKYSESISHLKDAISMQWNDETVWNIMGHNLYRMGEMDSAADCYAFVVDSMDVVKEYDLTFYRMGRILMERCDYEGAVKYLLKSVSLTPTPQAWTALAKASYWREELEDAELAAKEANRLDYKSSTPWAVLGLANYRNTTEPTLAEHCLAMANQCGDIDSDLSEEIEKVTASYGENINLTSISLVDLSKVEKSTLSLDAIC